MNTNIEYLYRDADNYKVQNHCVIQGEITPEQIEQIMDCLDAGEYFIPRQVGLPEERFSTVDPERDHPWFELSEYSFEPTDLPYHLPLTPSELVQKFQAAKGHWDDSFDLEEVI